MWINHLPRVAENNQLWFLLSDSPELGDKVKKTPRPECINHSIA